MNVPFPLLRIHLPTTLSLITGLALALVPASPVRAAESATGTTVELPPMVIEEAANLPPWLYVRTDDTEYLSRCTERTTRGYVEMRRSRMQWVNALFPVEFQLRTDVPVATVLTSQKQKSGTNTEVIGEVLNQRKAGPGGTSFVRTTTAPNMMLFDADMTGVFAYIDEDVFNRANLTVSSDYVSFLLERRLPALPVWLYEGMIAVYNDVLFTESPITLRPLIWLTPDDSAKLARDPSTPRALLSAGELFADSRRLPLRLGIARAQCALLVRWALDPRNGVRDAFWRFAARAAVEPVTEPMFQSCFGFGFSDLRDRLSDYLPTAVKGPLELPLGKTPVLAPLEVRRATPTEIARLRGEWERLSIPLVRHRFPQEAGRYLEQARRTLRRAYDDGDRDAQLLATLGLCEIDGGNEAEARGLLESAVASKVVRPRVYHELARLRWKELQQDQPPTREYSVAETQPIMKMVRQGLAQAPTLVEGFGLWADLWLHATTAPTADEVREFTQKSPLFRGSPSVCLRAVRALARHGYSTEAIALLGEGFLQVRDNATREEFAQLYTSLAKPK